MEGSVGGDGGGVEVSLMGWWQQVQVVVGEWRVLQPQWWWNALVVMAVMGMYQEMRLQLSTIRVGDKNNYTCTGCTRYRLVYVDTPAFTSR